MLTQAAHAFGIRPVSMPLTPDNQYSVLDAPPETPEHLWSEYRLAWKGVDIDLPVLLLRAIRLRRAENLDLLLETLIRSLSQDLEQTTAEEN